MGGLIFIFIAFILIVILVLVILLWGQTQKKNYGPQQLLDGPTFCSGSLSCKSWKAPTLGKQLQFDYKLEVTANNKEITGFYRYPIDENQKEIYSGQIFITKENGNLVGRTDRKYFEGSLTHDQADIQTMFRALPFAKAPFQFRLINSTVDFTNTDNSQTIINHNSQLSVTADHIQGRVVHSQESWITVVDITYENMAPELMTLIVLLISNDILDFHHDK
jgi:hypothetical protein